MTEHKNKQNDLQYAMADVVLTNGTIFTADKENLFAQAMALKGDKIIFVGNQGDIGKFVGPKTQCIDLCNKMALPGFIDSHLHVSSGAEDLYMADLTQQNSVQDYIAILKNYWSENPDCEYIAGSGWEPFLLGEEGNEKKLLDSITTQIPIILWDESFHNLWVNSKALTLAGISPSSKDPVNGVIERDPFGVPTGILRESAMDLVTNMIPPFTVEQLVEGYGMFQKMALSYGITTVYDAGIFVENNQLRAYRQMEKSKALLLRYKMGIVADPDKDIKELIAEAKMLQEEYSGSRFAINSIKILLDGVVEGHTAYMDAPYTDRPETCGSPIWSPKDLCDLCIQAEQAGFRIHIHSIGDASTHLALEALGTAKSVNASKDFRHIITHLEFVREKDIPAFKELGVLAVIQPYWFEINSYYDGIVAFVGEERAEKQYPCASFLQAGVLVASSSDYNVTPKPRPLEAIEMGITRTHIKGDEEEGDDKCLPPAQECVTLQDMLLSFTINGAYALSMEEEVGSLTVGKKADIVVLDKNLFDLPSASIHTAKEVMTLIDGKIVYQFEE